MRLEKPFILSSVALLGLLAMNAGNVGAVGQEYEVTIDNGVFSDLSITMDHEDTLRFQNNDDVTYTLKLDSASTSIGNRTNVLTPDDTYTPPFDDSHVDTWTYYIQGNEAQVGTLVVTAVSPTATPSATVSATATASPTATPTVVPTATVTPTPTVSSSPTLTPTQSPTPTAVPTATVSPTATPIPTLTPTPSATSTVSPTVVPTSTPTLAPTASPTATPVPTPLPEGTVPGFSLFRSTQCTAEVIGDSVITERLSSSKLVRGYWDIEEMSSSQGVTSLDVELDRVRVINLFFRSLFFKGDVTYNNLDQSASFEGTSLNNVLGQASDAWCQQAMLFR